MSLRIATQFQKSLAELLIELYSRFPGEMDLMAAQVYVSTVATPDQIICSFIKHLLPDKEQIANRDDSFFIDKVGSMMGADHRSKFDYFKRLWQSSVLDKEDRDDIWCWFDAFVLLAEKYGELKSKQ